MKNLNILLLALGVVLCSTSSNVMAVGDDVVVYVDHQKFDEQKQKQLVAIFTEALENPEICEQLKKQVSHIRQTPSVEDDSFKEVMMLKKIEMMDAMTEKLNPKKKDSKKKEESFFNEVLTGAMKTVKGSTTFVVQQVLGFGIITVGVLTLCRVAPELVYKLVPALKDYVMCGRSVTQMLAGYQCPA